jgi:hypothetical protein
MDPMQDHTQANCAPSAAKLQNHARFLVTQNVYKPVNLLNRGRPPTEVLSTESPGKFAVAKALAFSD